MASARNCTVALAGNPNSGKTTLFNNLTGARQHVGNYPGVTIEKKAGSCKFQGSEIEVVDLPGTYSLTAYSPEELVARRFILEESPDVVISILDASNLERNLYLTVQFLELGVPLVIACNMMDLVENSGDKLDLEALSTYLKVPVVRTVGQKRQGTEDLLKAVSLIIGTKSGTAICPMYSPELMAAITDIEQTIDRDDRTRALPRRWAAIKLLENDPAIRSAYSGTEALELAKSLEANLVSTRGEQIETIFAQERYQFITLVSERVLRPSGNRAHTFSDRLDSFLTHRVFGLPIFLLTMFLVFFATFKLGGIPQGWIQSGVGKLAEVVGGLWPKGSASPLRSLLVDGAIGGVGSVITFLPNVLVLFLAIGILEDSGYMPRAAFIMDRLMNKLGMHGKSFIPLLLGFGCSVPAIMATRTLENRRDRLTTMLVAPLMSCGARLPIYALIIPAFFPSKWQAPVLWIVYVIGVFFAIVVAKMLRATVFQGSVTPFVMELPPYRIPSLRSCTLNMMERSGLYVKKAGTIILALSMILWVLTNYPKPPEKLAQNTAPAVSAQIATLVPVARPAAAAPEADLKAQALAYSFAGRLGRSVEPVLRPMGFDWKIGTALVGALAAKEVFVAQMGIVYSAGSEDGAATPLRDQLRKNYTPLVGFCIMLYCLLSAPCIATFAVTRRESGAWSWAIIQFGGLTVLAYVVTTVVYQAGTFMGLGV